MIPEQLLRIVLLSAAVLLVQIPTSDARFLEQDEINIKPSTEGRSLGWTYDVDPLNYRREAYFGVHPPAGSSIQSPKTPLRPKSSKPETGDGKKPTSTSSKPKASNDPKVGKRTSTAGGDETYCEDFQIGADTKTVWERVKAKRMYDQMMGLFVDDRQVCRKCYGKKLNECSDKSADSKSKTLKPPDGLKNKLQKHPARGVKDASKTRGNSSTYDLNFSDNAMMNITLPCGHTLKEFTAHKRVDEAAGKLFIKRNLLDSAWEGCAPPTSCLLYHNQAGYAIVQSISNVRAYFDMIKDALRDAQNDANSLMAQFTNEFTEQKSPENKDTAILGIFSAVIGIGGAAAGPVGGVVGGIASAGLSLVSALSDLNKVKDEPSPTPGSFVFSLVNAAIDFYGQFKDLFLADGYVLFKEPNADGKDHVTLWEIIDGGKALLAPKEAAKNDALRKGITKAIFQQTTLMTWDAGKIKPFIYKRPGKCEVQDIPCKHQVFDQFTLSCEAQATIDGDCYILSGAKPDGKAWPGEGGGGCMVTPPPGIDLDGMTSGKYGGLKGEDFIRPAVENWKLQGKKNGGCRYTNCHRIYKVSHASFCLTQGRSSHYETTSETTPESTA